MKKNLLLLLFVGLSFTINAQIKFRDANCQTNYNNNDTIYLQDEIAFVYNLYNSNNSQINCKLEIVELSIPTNSNYVTMCAGVSCFPISEPRVLVNSQTIEANSCSTDFKDIEYSNGTATTPFFIRIKATNLNNTKDTAFLCFMYPAPNVSLNISNNTNLLISPNPANDLLILNAKENNLKNGQILNSKGQIVTIFSIENNSTIIDISNLPKGIYFVKIEKSVQKFIKN